MNYINRYLRNFKPYSVASHKVWQVDDCKREDILKLDWNESTIQPSPVVYKRLNNLMNTKFLNLYPETYNNRIYELLSRYVGIGEKNIQYFASSDSLHEYIAKLYITVGDPVLILWPSYDNFRLTAQVAGANVIFYNMGSDFSMNFEELVNKIDNKQPSLVYICNPNNPTGSIIDNMHIEKLVSMFEQTIFLIDEAYIEFSPEYSCKELVKQYDNLLISRTMSKAFGLANVRFGYLIASEENINYISSIRNPKNITTFAQEAVIGALSDIEYMKKYVCEVNLSKKYFIDSLKNITCSPFTVYESYGNFVMIECQSTLVKNEIISYLERRNVFVRNLSQSKMLEKCIRVTIGTCDQMKFVVRLFENYVNETRRHCNE